MENKRASILFVEDDVNLSFVTKDNLEKNGYKVTHCADGISAMETFESGKFDICVFDVMLPKLDGFTLARQIRLKNKQVPILFLTAKSLKEDKIEGLSLGADDYITKPFNIEELILKIEIFLRRSKVLNTSGKDENTFYIGRYFFDFEGLTLTCGENKSRLTAKEAELLRFFCRNRNKVLKREEILNTLWGDDDYFIGRSLDVFISRLRKYLKEDPAIKIENVHGVGFQLSVEENQNS
jgi:DNA-binding response OmpR family regulator